MKPAMEAAIFTAMFSLKIAVFIGAELLVFSY